MPSGNNSFYLDDEDKSEYFGEYIYAVFSVCLPVEKIRLLADVLWADTAH